MITVPTTAADGRSELSATIRLAVPVVFVQLGFMLMGVVDTLMVGRLSASALASVAIGNLYFFNVTIFGSGTLMALDPIIAQAVGAGDDETVATSLQRGLILSIGLSVLTALLLAPAAPVLRGLHQPVEIIPATADYVRISIVGVAPYFAFVVLRQSLQALHRVAPIVATVVAANLVNAFFNWVFVYGHLGSPALGVAGSAIATSIGRWLMFLLLLLIAWRDIRPHVLPRREGITSWPALRRMLAIGAPIGAQQALEAGAFGAIGLLMGLISTTAVAAHQIAITLAAFTFMVPLGVGSAAAVRVGHAIGAGDIVRARSAIRAAYAAGVGFMALTALMFLGAPTLLARAFTTDAAVIEVAATLIPIAGFFQVFDGGQAVGAGVLRGAGDTRAPLIVMLTGYWLIGVPVSAYLGFRTSLGAAGLWWGFVISLAAVAVFLNVRIRRVFARTLERVAV
jgi:MATE family multidrug resistance protein